MIRALIVEDEPLAARGLSHMLTQTGLVEVVGIAGEAGTALYLCGQEKPNAAFLDIRLPGPDGISLAAKMSLLPDSPVLVFTTGHADRASEAFDLDAAHYLLKPITPAAVRAAVERIASRLASANAANHPEPAPGPQASDERVPIRDAGGDVTMLVPPHHVLAAVRRRRRTWIHTADGEYPTYYPLSGLEKVLAEPAFMRVSREAIVNVQGIQSVVHSGDRAYSLVLSDRNRTRLEASRSGAKQIARLLKPPDPRTPALD